jgi:signal transduction histidine kinase/ligand-binding sensor domain-containing protein
MPSPVSRRTSLLRRLIFAGVVASVFSGGFAPRAVLAVDYLIDPWDTREGLPGSTVAAIAQTPDGYLWLGTYNGLARFDGVRFVSFDPGNRPELTHARVQGLYVDARGTLWINTYRGGLTSYHGDFRNEVPGQAGFDLHTTLAWSSSNTVIFATQYGEVMIGKVGPTNTEWKTFPPPNSSRPLFKCADRTGNLWFVDRDGHVLRFLENSFTNLPDDNGLARKHVITLAAAPDGSIWAGSENEIARWNGSRFETMTPTNGEATLTPNLLLPTRSGAVWVLDGDRLRKMVGRQWVTEVNAWRGLLSWTTGRATGAHEDRDGGVWFNHYGNGLFHITRDGQFQRVNGLPGERVGAWYQGRDGGVWLGIDRGGLARLRERKFQAIGPAEGLPARIAASVCEDRNGAIWIGTGGGGLCKWSNGKISAFSVGNNASANFVFSVFPSADGNIWFSAGEAENAFRFDGENLSRAPWDPRGVKAILQDQTGRVWFGTKVGLAWWSPEGRRLFSANSGLAGVDPSTTSAIRALAEGPDCTVWCGSDDGTLYRCEPDRLQAFHPTDGHGEAPIWSLLADRDGAVWAGTFRGGLLRFKNGSFKRFTEKQGLYVRAIVQLLEDNQGRLWMGTHQGIFSASKAALNACADGKTKSVDWASYGRLDGLPSLECSDGYQPSCWHGSDGKLWFATTRGVVSVNPAELTGASPPPSVVIEEFHVDDSEYKIPNSESGLRNSKLKIPPGHKQFEFRFTALSFDAPDKARFRYRIEPLDTEWVDADNVMRNAKIGRLAPGNYRFHVIACNNEGVWNEAGAVLPFTVLPHFYETWWFLSLTTLVVLGVVVITVRRAATQKYRLKLARLEQQHAIERDRARIAKDIHDDIGAGLTQITLLSELARREPEQAVNHLDRISGSARHLTRAMDEIVWAVDPQHDTLNGLMDYISAYAEDFLRVAGIRCRMDLPNTLPDVRIEAELRYNLFLALKETLNNVVKHAHATEVWLRLRIEEKSFALIVEDNGCGLPEGRNGDTKTTNGTRLASGFGLVNLEKRLATIGGRCVVKSKTGEGTRVDLSVTLNGPVSPVVAIVPNAESALSLNHEN